MKKSHGETKSHWSRLSGRQAQLRLLMLGQNSLPETMLFPSTSPARFIQEKEPRYIFTYRLLKTQYFTKTIKIIRGEMMWNVLLYTCVAFIG